MVTDPTMRKAIVASVVASIIVIVFIQPILGTVWRLILFSSRYLTDQIYSGASLGERNYLDFIVFSYLIVAIMGLVSARFLYVWLVKSRPDSEKSALLGLARRSFDSRLYIAVAFLSMILSGFYLLAATFIDLQLNTSFKQRLTVLAPYISDQEHEEILASWASMRTRADYEAITRRMDETARARNVQLPEPLLK